MSRQGTVEVTSDGDLVVVRVSGELDDVTGRVLVDLAESAVAGSVRGLAIDLGGVDDVSPAGVAALSACSEIAQPLAAGVRFCSSAQVAVACASTTRHHDSRSGEIARRRRSAR